METDPRYIGVEINGKKAEAVFLPGQYDCYCRPELLQALGIPISVQPVIYKESWSARGGFFTSLCPIWQSASACQSLEKVWILPLDITVGKISRRGVPVIVKLVPGDCGQEEGTPVNPAMLVLGNGFFKPGTYALTEKAIAYQGPLLVTVEKPTISNRRYASPDGSPLPPMSKQAAAHIEGVAKAQQQKAMADVASLRAEEAYKQGEHRDPKRPANRF